MKRLMIVWILAFSSGILGVFSASASAPDVTEDGLHRVQGTKLAEVYADPEADLGQYRRVRFTEATVAFKKNWLRDQRMQSVNRVTPRDVEKIKSGLASLFHEVFTTVLQDAGYELTDENAEDVLLIVPAIVNLDVYAPDTMQASRSRSYTQSAGEMTLYVELYDSVTRDLLAKAIDRKTDRYSGSSARQILNGWAEILVNALNEAHARKASAG